MIEDISDEAILQRRFVAQEALLTRLLRQYQRAGRTIKQASSSHDDCTQQYQLMMRELSLFEHSMNRGRTSHGASLREIDAHIHHTKSVDGQLGLVRSEIEALRIQLEEEKHLRRQKEEYEALAKLINEQQSRDDTLKQLSEVNNELQLLHEEKAATKAELEKKCNDFGLFFHAAQQLSASFASSNNTNITNTNSNNNSNINGSTGSNTNSTIGAATTSVASIVTATATGVASSPNNSNNNNGSTAAATA